MPWRVQFDRVITWRDWVAAISKHSGRTCTVKSSGPPQARTWRIKCPGLKGWIVVHDRGGNAWEIVGEASREPFVAEAARELGGIDVDVRTIARETPGVIDYVTGWFDDALGSVRLTREPAGAFGEIRILVTQAREWCVVGGESERAFDTWERDEDRGPVDVAKLLGELRALGATDAPPLVLEELVDWLACAHDDGARVHFVRT